MDMHFGWYSVGKKCQYDMLKLLSSMKHTIWLFMSSSNIKNLMRFVVFLSVLFCKLLLRVDPLSMPFYKLWPVEVAAIYYRLVLSHLTIVACYLTSILLLNITSQVCYLYHMNRYSSLTKCLPRRKVQVTHCFY